eukprot:GHVT01073899.1.p1 GENE.GHVT01073899.1~~GHVT01073899.1.p1  ORF type:complete len:260 (+),score=75.88 GHVT01073899.1:696-1475(+)
MVPSSSAFPYSTCPSSSSSSRSSPSSSSPPSLSCDYPRAQALRRELDSLLDAFTTGADRSVATQQRLGALTREFNQLVQQLQGALAAQQHALPHKETLLWRRRLNVLSDEATSLRTSLEKQFGHVYRLQTEEAERARLLEAPGPHGGAEESAGAQRRERAGLEESHLMLDAVTAQGRRVVESLGGQNKLIKNARKRLLDVASSVGISSSVLGAISRRHTVDKYIAYAGMLFIVILCLVLWKYTHSKNLTLNTLDVQPIT